VVVVVGVLMLGFGLMTGAMWLWVRGCFAPFAK